MLLTKELRKKLPHLYANEDKGLDALALIHFFTPDSNWDWYASEGSPVDENGYYDTDKEKIDFLFFGLVKGHEAELGYFSLKELSEIRGPWKLPIEREYYWEPKTLGKLLAEFKKQGY